MLCQPYNSAKKPYKTELMKLLDGLDRNRGPWVSLGLSGIFDETDDEKTARLKTIEGHPINWKIDFA